MSRLLLTIMIVLAVSACTDNRPYGSTQPNSRSTHEAGMGDTNTRDVTRSGKAPKTTYRTADGSQPTEGMRASPTSTDRGMRDDSTLTAGDQSDDEGDLKITQQIRKAVVADSSLSIKAQNCTIITKGGVVTIRGSVDTAAERQSIASKADGVTGVRRVDNNLEIMR